MVIRARKFCLKNFFKLNALDADKIILGIGTLYAVSVAWLTPCTSNHMVQTEIKKIYEQPIRKHLNFAFQYITSCIFLLIAQ